MNNKNYSRIVFSFDDARYDSYEAIKIAAQYGIKSTLNVTTGFVEGILPESCKDFPVPAMTKEQVVELSHDDLVEIACHGHFHKNNLEDILVGKKVLGSWLDDGYKLGFVSPGSSVNFDEIPLEKFKENNFLFVRIGPRWGLFGKVLRVLRKVSRVLKSKRLFYLGYKGTIQKAVDENYLIHGVPVIHDNTLEQFEYMISKASKKRSLDVVLIWHSVLDLNAPSGTDNWSWNKEDYIKLCEIISSKLGDNLHTCFTKELID
jgi:hypothetical protein